jgi:hypothetical protein
MRNRSTDLIEWNDTLSGGMGCSGTRYTLSYDHSADDRPLEENARGHWLIVVDGATLSSARSVQDALARSEGLEALRCILQGRCDQISDEHCRVAELLAWKCSSTGGLGRSLRRGPGSVVANVDPCRLYPALFGWNASTGGGKQSHCFRR